MNSVLTRNETQADLARIEWPEAGIERLSPGLEPITWPAEPRRGAQVRREERSLVAVKA